MALPLGSSIPVLLESEPLDAGEGGSEVGSAELGSGTLDDEVVLGETEDCGAVTLGAGTEVEDEDGPVLAEEFADVVALPVFGPTGLERFEVEGAAVDTLVLDVARGVVPPSGSLSLQLAAIRAKPNGPTERNKQERRTGRPKARDMPTPYSVSGRFT
jgi:hypothetical protein